MRPIINIGPYMQSAIKFLLLLVMLGFTASVFADSYPAKGSYYNNAGSSFGTEAAACSAYVGSGGPYFPDGLDSSGRSHYCVNALGVRSSYSVVWSCPSGGVINFVYPFVCNNAPACPIGETRDPTTGECTSGSCPPFGDAQKLAVQVGMYESSSDEIYDADVGRSYNNTVVYGGREYAFMYPDDFAGTCWSKTGTVYCDYNAFSTGVCPQTGEQAETQTPSNPSVPASKNSSGNQCVTDSRGNTICSSSPQGNKKCGTVNGTEICFDTTNGVGTVNGQPYQTSDKNCGMVNGQPVCVSNNSNSPTTKACLVNGGVKACVNEDVKIDSQVTQNKNPDGSVTTTETKQDNIIGHSPVVKSTTIGTDGTVTTVSTPGQVGVGDGVAQNSGGGSGNCFDCAKDGTLQEVKSGLDDLKGGSPKAHAQAFQPGVFDPTVPQGKAAQAKAEYTAAFLAVKSQVSNLFVLSGGGGGQLPVFDFGDIKGVHVVVDLNRYADPFSWIGLLILFLAAYIAVRIFLE